MTPGRSRFRRARGLVGVAVCLPLKCVDVRGNVTWLIAAFRAHGVSTDEMDDLASMMERKARRTGRLLAG